MLNVVVQADYQLEVSPNTTVIGVDSRGTSYILAPKGAFNTTTERVAVTQVMTSQFWMTSLSSQHCHYQGLTDP